MNNCAACPRETGGIGCPCDEEELTAHLTRVTIPEELQARGFRFVFDDSPLSVLSEKPDQGAETMNYTQPWCLHKESEEEWNITRMCDGVEVWLWECNGVRTEER